MEGVIEGVDVSYLPADRRDLEVERLERPWIADEGPLDVALRRANAGEVLQLRVRVLAFDADTTVVWDEDGVQVVRRAAPEAGVVPLLNDVLVRERFAPRPARLVRIDYLRAGVLLGSRYQVQPEATAHA